VQTVKRLLGGVGVASLGGGLTFEISVTPFADPLVWAGVWCWLLAVGVGAESRRREALAAACLVVAVAGFSLAWVGAADWRTTTFPAAGVVLGCFGGGLALQLLAGWSLREGGSGETAS
jgi:hypothetical protein